MAAAEFIDVAFRAHAVDASIQVDTEEITEACWFTREELLEAARTGEALVPAPISIARDLIERWVGEPLPAENAWQYRTRRRALARADALFRWPSA